MINDFSPINNFLNNSSFFYTIAIGMDSCYAYVSKNYDRNFEFTNGTLLGRHFSVTLHPEDVSICAAVGAQCFHAPGQLFAATLRKHDGRGGFVVTQWEMQAYFDEQGQPEGIYCMGYNITEFIDTQSRLDSAHHQLHEIGFIQSHLVRKPLANIIGLSNLISQESKDKGLTDLCLMLTASTTELDQVIKDISNKTDE
ncbi:PAS domain-containing protein [Mucilaginibacter jinjuensis]|uniref:PAS domain-containing protein n=1 Tax=Mucilaginibacter jinjuensis TaxID=1176721 RepID=A0ABY7TFF0_9SPHI|nr:PAS domain-containing protein [Mucilaginibacter jinjuensis]WCT14453.1 PAS domain-containing protein [Mucilaginibacter jinjuensis]